jgi:type IV pilus assembly protein PilF
MPHSSKTEQAEQAARIHTELGQRYLQDGDLQTALQKLTMALGYDADYAPAHTIIAMIYERIGDFSKAEWHYRRAFELEPKKGDTNNNLGAFLCKIGKPSQAEPYFRTAIADPFYATPDVAWTNAGICALRAGHSKVAEIDFRRAIERNTSNSDALYQLAALLYKRHDAFHARAFLQRYEALGHPSVQALRLGQQIENRLGNRDAARNYANRLQGQFSELESTHAHDATVSP